MKKWLKYFAATVACLIVLVAVLAAILVLTVNPNQFKPRIVALVKQHTGRDLSIQGNISWTFFPYIGLEVHEVSLANPPGFAEPLFAKIDDFKFNLKLLPLFRAHIESSGVTLNGLHLNLIKRSDGVTNWQDLSQPTASATSAPATQEKSSGTLLGGSLAVIIPHMAITHSDIHWQDASANQTVVLHDMTFSADNVNLSEAFPVQVDLGYQVQQPAKSGSLHIQTMASLDVYHQQYRFTSLKVALSAETPKPSVNLTVSGDLAADLQQNTAKFSNLKIQLANITVQGQLAATHLDTGAMVNGDLSVADVDLKALLQNLGVDNASLQAASHGSVNLHLTRVPAASALAGITLKGQVHLQHLQAANLRLDNIAIPVDLQAGKLTLTPVTASLYQGSLQAHVNVDLNPAKPTTVASLTLTSIQAAPLLEDLNAKSRFSFSGVGNIDLQVTTLGSEVPDITQNLNGKARVEFRDGVVSGVDVAYWADAAHALLQRQTNATQDTGKTSFGTLTATADIHNGVLDNNDLLVDSPRFDTKGQGKIDLVNQTINYHLQTVSKDATAQKGGSLLNVYNLTIPIEVSGTFSAPKVALDTTELVKDAAKQQLKSAAQKLTNSVSGPAAQVLQNFLGH